MPSSRPTIVKSAWLYTYQQSCETTTYHPRLTAPATDLRSRGQASRCGRSKHNTPMTANPLTTAPHARAQYRRPRKAPTSVVELHSTASPASIHASRRNSRSRASSERGTTCTPRITNVGLSAMMIPRTVRSPKNDATGPANPTDSTKRATLASTVRPPSCAICSSVKSRRWTMARLSPSSFTSCTQPAYTMAIANRP